MIEIKVDGQIVSVQNTEPLYVGAVDIQKCHFTFDASWRSFSKTAVFRVGATTHTELVDENDCCVLPWELLTRKHIGRQLEVGVYGVSADTEIMTSVWDTLGMVREGSEPGSDARNPADGIYEQIMAKLQRIYEALGIYDDGMQALVQRTETAAQLANESAVTATAALKELKKLLENGGGMGTPSTPSAPEVPYCIEYGTLAYSADTTQVLPFYFSQSYVDAPVFIPYVNHEGLTVQVEALQSEMGYYGGTVTVTNKSGETIDATIAISAYCAIPNEEGSESE